MVWQKAGFDCANYAKVMFEPLRVFLAAESEYKGFRADEVDALGATSASIVALVSPKRRHGAPRM